MKLSDALPQLRRLVAELRRRRVPHAVAAYAVAAWVIVQIAAITFPALYLPRWAVALVVLLAVLGFPVTAVLFWAFEFRREGIRKTPEIEGTPVVGPRTRGVLAVAVVLLTAGLGWAGWQHWIQPRMDSGAEATAGTLRQDLDPSRLAVLYFDDYSAADTLEHFARGLTEDLIHELSQIRTLDVISRHGVQPYRDGGATLDSIARALRAGSVVEGSVHPVNGNLEVTVQLIDGRTQTHLMSRSLQRPVRDLFSLEDSLVRTLSRLLRQRIGRTLRRETRRSETSSVDAWDRVQRAKKLRSDAETLMEEGDRETAVRLVRRADSLLARAESLDPGWNRPRVLRARIPMTVVDLGADRWSPEESDLIEDGLSHADRAVEANPEDPAALTARGQLRYWRSRHTPDGDRASELIRAAEGDLREAVGLKSDAARAWYALAQVLLHRGENSEALYAARRAREHDAFLTVGASVYARLFEAAANVPDLAAAREWCRAGRSEYPDRAEFWSCELTTLASEWGPEADVERARRLVEEIRSRARPDQRGYWTGIARCRLAAVLARTREADSARAMLERAREATSSPVLAYEQAHVHLLLGDHQRALEHLESFVGALPQFAARVREDPWFRDLHDRPRFQKLVGG